MELFKKGDWKSEKHVPVIEIFEKDDRVEVRISVGKNIKHPNTKDHHIAWIQLFFLPEGSEFPVEILKVDFRAHGEGGLYTEPKITLEFNRSKKGKLIVFSYCNLHGLWMSEEEIGYG